MPNSGLRLRGDDVLMPPEFAAFLRTQSDKPYSRVACTARGAQIPGMDN